MQEETFSMVVLSVGLQIQPDDGHPGRAVSAST